jgi:hypothetical protein
MEEETCGKTSTALACLEGAHAMIPIAVKPVQLESDCAVVVHELTASKSSKSEISCIISEVKQLLSVLPGSRLTVSIAEYRKVTQ